MEARRYLEDKALPERGIVPPQGTDRGITHRASLAFIEAVAACRAASCVVTDTRLRDWLCIRCDFIHITPNSYPFPPPEGHLVTGILAIVYSRSLPATRRNLPTSFRFLNKPEGKECIRPTSRETGQKYPRCSMTPSTTSGCSSCSDRGVLPKQSRSSFLEGNFEHTLLVAAVHALRLLKDHVLTEMSSGAFREPLREGAEPPGRRVTHDEDVRRRRIIIELRNLSSRVNFPDFSMDNVIQRKQKRPSCCVPLEKLRVLACQ